MNRFSKDQDVVDTLLVRALEQAIQGIMICLSIIVLIAAVFPVFLAVIACLCGIYYFLQVQLELNPLSDFYLDVLSSYI